MLRIFVLGILVAASLGLRAAEAANYSYALPVNIDIAYDTSQGIPTGSSFYDLADRRADTSAAVGKWIRFDLFGSRTVTGLVIVNGDGRPGEYEQNARVKTIRVEYPSGESKSFELPDTRTPQTLPLAHVTVRSLKLIIESVYPGSRSDMPYLSTARILGYDPSAQQVRLSGRYTGCGAGFDPDMAYCQAFVTDDGQRYGCSDDLCYHPTADTQGRVVVIGIIKPGNILEVLDTQRESN